MNRIFVFILIFALLGGVVYLAFHWNSRRSETEIPAGTIRIVAAENFYGDIARQLGGDKVSVSNIISNPDIDPHEYEPTIADSAAVANANIVIKNGMDYDAWMDKLLSTSPNSQRTVLSAAAIARNILPDNPHVWYGVDNMKTIAGALAAALEKISPADKSFFENNLANFNNSLNAISQKMNEIKSRYAGTPVGLTETIYLYQTNALGLNVLTPFDFEKAIAEGNDPPALAVAETNNQISQKEIKVFIYNSQAITPIVANLKNSVVSRGIPIVPVTETMPVDSTYQSWMLGELNALENVLAEGIK